MVHLRCRRVAQRRMYFPSRYHLPTGADCSIQRQHWIPYFDDVQAIIFLAPLAFNLTLEEDAKVNRLVRSSVFPDWPRALTDRCRRTQSRYGAKSARTRCCRRRR